MTDKEKLNAIRAEVQNYIDAAHKAHTNITEGNFAHLLSFIDSLQEEPVDKCKGCNNVKGCITCVDGDQWAHYKESENEDMEEACDFYYNETWDEHGGKAMVVDGCHDIWFPSHATDDFFKAGAKWQKEQDQSTIELAKDHAMLAGMNRMEEEMMSKAIDASCFGFQDAALFSFRLPADKYLVGSEVKVIVINKD